MAKPKKPRNKRYTPRERLVDPVTWAVAGVHKLPTESIATMFAPIDAAVLLLRQGKATRDDWNVVAQALNMAEALAKLAIGAHLVPEIVGGQRWLHQVALRMIEGGAWSCYDAELAAIEEGLAVHRAQLEICNQAELSRAVAHVKNLHRSGAMVDVAPVFEQMAG